MNYLTSFLLIFSLLMPACKPAQQSSSEGKEENKNLEPNLELRVTSFNIRYGSADDGGDSWQHRKELLLLTIQESGADLIGLQEALRFQIDEIRAALPQYAEIGVGRDDGAGAGEYSAILYLHERFEVRTSGTFWLSDTPETPGSMTWGNSFPRICTWGRFVDKQSSASFYHYNTHFDHISQPSREKGAVLLARRITNRDSNDPVVVTGDFNAGEDNPAILFLKGKKDDLTPAGGVEIQLVDTYRTLWPEATQVGTFHAFSGNREGDKVDYVFVSPDITTLEAEIDHTQRSGKYPSDHFPVTARLQLPGK